jgi:hypothetical protein
VNEWFLSKEIEEAHLYIVPENNEARGFWKNCGFDIILERWKKRLLKNGS